MIEAVQYHQLGGPEVLQLAEIADPVPQGDEVLVEVKAAGVNPIDAKLRSGVRATAPLATPRVPGSDGAGVIVALGVEVTGWNIGDPVVFTGARGAYGTHTRVPAHALAAKPEGLSWVKGAALGIPAGTAYQALLSLGVGSHKSLLIHAASGAVGQAAIQFARYLGAEIVIGTARETNHERIRHLGGVPVSYGLGLADRVREIASDGVDRVLDCAGTDEAIEASLALVEDPQLVATIVRGADAPGYGIRAFSGGSLTPLTEQELAWRLEGMRQAVKLIIEGRFEVEIAAELPLAEATQAHSLLEGGQLRGKIVLIP